MSSTIAGAGIDRLRVEAIDLNRDFTSLGPLAGRIRLVSLNASLAAGTLGEEGAPFGVVARTLGGLATELTDLLAFDVEFDEVVRALGDFANSVERFRTIQRTQQLHYTERGPATDPAVRDDLERDAATTVLRPGAALAWRHEAERVADDPLATTLWRSMLELLHETHRHLSRFDQATRRLAERLQRVRSVAVTEARFVGTNALVEAARVSGAGSDLGPLAHQIDEVANEVADRAARACARMDLVRALASQLLTAVGRDSVRDGEGK